MTATTVKSRKGKARLLQNSVAADLREKFSLPEEDIRPAIMGMGGRDILFSKTAEDRIPFDIECKRCENWSVERFWKQTVDNTKEGRKPLLLMKKNREPTLALLRWDDLKEVWCENNK